MRKYFSSALILSLIIIIPVTNSCSSRDFAPPPLIPAEYYKCQAVVAVDLVNAYYSNYFNISVSRVRFDNQIFVLKNIELSNDQITHLRKEGLIWVDLIECNLANAGDCGGFKTGDEVDVVGINSGPSMEFYGLEFLDCFMIPAGALKLPADDSGQAVIGGY